MIDLSMHRARASLTADASAERKRMGTALLAQLRALALAVEHVLPELTPLNRTLARPDVAVLSVAWHAKGSHIAEAPQLLVALLADRVEVSWGFQPARGERRERDRQVAEMARRRRALGDGLVYRLVALRAAGAELYASRREPVPVSEEEWLRAAAGAVAFRVALHEVPEGAVLVRLVADRLARLAGLASILGSFVLEPSPIPSRTRAEVLTAIRSLRWDERALGAGAPPAGLVTTGRSVQYDPVTGWFAPASLAALAPASASHVQLLLDLNAVWDQGAFTGTTATVGHGLHARLGRWLAARGVATAMRDAPMVEVRVAALSLPLPGEIPPLERVVAAVLEDPSGDAAAALAGLLVGAPWTEGDPFDAKHVGSKVTPRFSASAMRGVARLTERNVLERSVTGSLDVLGECLTDEAIRPVLVMAVERALGHLDVFPADARERGEHRQGRPWELAAGTPRAATLESVSRRFLAYARASGMAFDLDLVRAFVVGLRAKPFAILTGVSGTGKTRLAQLFARFMTESLGPVVAASAVAVVPVRPDWLDSRGLLGYFNVLRGAGTYEDTAALRLILHASEHPNVAHFLVLDEMNLARVEHYLAEILSAMESGATIPLHGRPGGVPSVDGSRTIPPELVLPPNLFLLGTVNVDETTHTFSTKVLDRAWTWEFSPAPPTALLRDWLGDRRPVPPATDDERRAVLEAGNDEDPMRSVVLAMGHDGVGQRIDRIFAAMSSGGRPFGFRVATEVLRFVHLCEREGIETPPAWWLDHAVLGKILPRLAGARRDLEGVLRALLVTCTPAVNEGSYAQSATRERGVAEASVSTARGEDLTRTADKLRELLARLEKEPFVTFAR